MLLEYGARLGTIIEYAHSLLPIGAETDESWINHYGIVSEVGIDLLMPFETSPGHFRFMPGPEFSPRLYRGQNKFWKSCVPSLYRPEIKSIDAFFWIAKAIELSVLLEQHPATLDLAAYQLEGLSFEFSIEAIVAQRALAVRLKHGENLNEMPWVRCSQIEITPELSHRYFEMFDGGKKLFPENPFDDYIKGLRSKLTVPLRALEFGINQGLLPKHPDGISGARKALISAGYSIESCTVDVSPDVIQAATDEWAKRKADYFGRVRMRGACDHLVLES